MQELLTDESFHWLSVLLFYEVFYLFTLCVCLHMYVEVDITPSLHVDAED